MKSGFVSVVGRTNAGKSSIINSLLEEKITLVSHKKNTTRRKINAIIMHEDNQIIFIDTPGLHKSEKKLNQMMTDLALKSMNEVDLILFVASIYDELDEYENFIKLSPKIPHIVLINKVDLADNEILLKKLSQYNNFSQEFQSIVPYSCKHKSYKKILLDEVVKYLPKHPYFFDPTILTNTNEKDIYKDFILEALYESFSDELPYHCDVMIKEFKEKKELLFISADIITTSNSHKAMLIGKDGLGIKRLGKKSRIKIQKLAQKKVMLKLFVLVKKKWDKDEEFIKSLINT